MEDLLRMTRKELQALCKKHGVPANLKNVEMAGRLSSLFKDEEAQEKEPSGSGGGGGSSENVKVEVKKKVRFHPENDVYEFVDTYMEVVDKEIAEARRDRASRRRGLRKNGPKKAENGNAAETVRYESEEIRMTRSRKPVVIVPPPLRKRAKTGGDAGSETVEKGRCGDSHVFNSFVTNASKVDEFDETVVVEKDETRGKISGLKDVNSLDAEHTISRSEVPRRTRGQRKFKGDDTLVIGCGDATRPVIKNDMLAGDGSSVDDAVPLRKSCRVAMNNISDSLEYQKRGTGEVFEKKTKKRLRREFPIVIPDSDESITLARKEEKNVNQILGSLLSNSSTSFPSSIAGLEVDSGKEGQRTCESSGLEQSAVKVKPLRRSRRKNDGCGSLGLPDEKSLRRVSNHPNQPLKTDVPESMDLNSDALPCITVTVKDGICSSHLMTSSGSELPDGSVEACVSTSEASTEKQSIIYTAEDVSASNSTNSLCIPQITGCENGVQRQNPIAGSAQRGLEFGEPDKSSEFSNSVSHGLPHARCTGDVVSTEGAQKHVLFDNTHDPDTLLSTEIRTCKGSTTEGFPGEEEPLTVFHRSATSVEDAHEFANDSVIAGEVISKEETCWKIWSNMATKQNAIEGEYQETFSDNADESTKTRFSESIMGCSSNKESETGKQDSVAINECQLTRYMPGPEVVKILNGDTKIDEIASEDHSSAKNQEQHVCIGNQYDLKDGNWEKKLEYGLPIPERVSHDEADICEHLDGEGKPLNPQHHVEEEESVGGLTARMDDSTPEPVVLSTEARSVGSQKDRLYLSPTASNDEHARNHHATEPSQELDKETNDSVLCFSRVNKMSGDAGMKLPAATKNKLAEYGHGPYIHEVCGTLYVTNSEVDISRNAASDDGVLVGLDSSVTLHESQVERDTETADLVDYSSLAYSPLSVETFTVENWTQDPNVAEKNSRQTCDTPEKLDDADEASLKFENHHDAELLLIRADSEPISNLRCQAGTEIGDPASVDQDDLEVYGLKCSSNKKETIESSNTHGSYNDAGVPRDGASCTEFPFDGLLQEIDDYFKWTTSKEEVVLEKSALGDDKKETVQYSNMETYFEVPIKICYATNAPMNECKCISGMNVEVDACPLEGHDEQINENADFKHVGDLLIKNDQVYQHEDTSEERCSNERGLSGYESGRASVKSPDVMQTSPNQSVSCTAEKTAEFRTHQSITGVRDASSDVKVDDSLVQNNSCKSFKNEATAGAGQAMQDGTSFTTDRLLPNNDINVMAIEKDGHYSDERNPIVNSVSYENNFIGNKGYQNPQILSTSNSDEASTGFIAQHKNNQEPTPLATNYVLEQNTHSSIKVEVVATVAQQMATIMKENMTLFSKTDSLKRPKPVSNRRRVLNNLQNN